MYGSGSYNNQFRPGPPVPPPTSFHHALPPPPPGQQALPPPPLPGQQPPLPPPTSHQAPLPPPPSHHVHPPSLTGNHTPPPLPHGHQTHSSYQHDQLSSLLPLIRQAPMTVPSSTIIQHGPPVPALLVPLGPSPLSVQHVMPPAVHMPDPQVMINRGQSYASPQTAHRASMMPPPYPGSQHHPPYPPSITPLHGRPPPAPAANPPTMPAPQPSSHGPTLYRSPSVPFPPSPSFPVPPTTFMSYTCTPALNIHSTSSLPPPPPPPLPSSPPPLPPPPPPPSSSPLALPPDTFEPPLLDTLKHVMGNNQASDDEPDNAHSAKPARTEDLADRLTITSDDPSPSLELKSDISPSSGWPNEEGRMRGHETAVKDAGQEVKWADQSLKDSQASEASPPCGGLTDKEKSMSPAVSDMDMEDDVYSPTKHYSNNQLVENIEVKSLRSFNKHLLYEEKLYAPESPTEQSPFQKSFLQVEALGASSRLNVKQEKDDQFFSPEPDFEDVSSAGDSPRATDENLSGSVHEFTRPVPENPTLLRVRELKSSMEEVSSFRLLTEYASDDSSDEDIKPKTSPGNVSPKVIGSPKEHHNFNSSGIEPTQPAGSDFPSRISSNRRDIEGFECSMAEKIGDHPTVDNSEPLKGLKSKELSSYEEVAKDAIAVQVDDAKIGFDSSSGDRSRLDNDPQNVPTTVNVDEFGRLIREGMSDSESDGEGPYSGRRGRRRRSHSHSQSPMEGRWRRSRSPRRWRDKRSRSRSWSPKKQRNKSKSPSARRVGNLGGERMWRDRGQAPVCFNFIRGKCFRGASCRFLHRDSAADDSSKRYNSKGYQHYEKHQVTRDFPGHSNTQVKMDIQEAKHLDTRISSVEYDATFSKKDKDKEGSVCGDTPSGAVMPLSITPNLCAELAKEDVPLPANEDNQVINVDAARRVDQPLVSQGLEDSERTQVPVEGNIPSLKESSPQHFDGSSVLSASSVGISFSQPMPVFGQRSIPPESQMSVPPNPAESPAKPSPKVGDKSYQPANAQPVVSCPPTQDLMPKSYPAQVFPSPSFAKAANATESFPGHSPVSQSVATESLGLHLLPKGDFHLSSISDDPKFHPPVAVTSQAFATGSLNLPPPPSQYHPPLSQAPASFLPQSLQQERFPIYPADARPLPPTLPRPPQSDLPLPTYVNEFPPRATVQAPDFRPPYQQTAGLSRNEFLLQPLGRPYPSDELMRSQQLDFYLQAPRPFGEPHKPLLQTEDMKHQAFPLESARDQSLGSEPFVNVSKNVQDRVLLPMEPESLQTQPVPRQDFHPNTDAFHDDLFRRAGPQLPGQSFNLPGSINQANFRHPFVSRDSHLFFDTYSREGDSWHPRGHSVRQMHNLPNEEIQPRAFTREGLEGSSFRDLSNFQQPSVASSFSLLQVGGASLLSAPMSSAKSLAFAGHSESFRPSTRSSLLSGIGSSQVPTTHYNPFASTFEEKPSKFQPQFDLSHLPIGRHIGSSLGSRPLSMQSASGDQYDPLFDSIEPSKRDTSKYSNIPDLQASVNAVTRSVAARACLEPGFVSTLGSSSQKLLDVEENNKQKGIESTIIKPSENDEFGEATLDAEVGAVENASPRMGDEDWSPGNPIDNANTGAGEIEIDQVQTPGKSKKSKDSRSMKLFKIAIAEFVKDVLKPSWRQGNMSKEAFKTIVKKTVDKVSGAMKNHQIPKSKAKIDQYVESSQRKLTKLVMGYVDKYVNA